MELALLMESFKLVSELRVRILNFMKVKNHPHQRWHAKCSSHMQALFQTKKFSQSLKSTFNSLEPVKMKMKEPLQYMSLVTFLIPTAALTQLRTKLMLLQLLSWKR